MAAVSLDDLSEATGMKRPSLYGAFGNKEFMYLGALSDFSKLFQEPAARLMQSSDCRQGLEEFFASALGLYGDRGCLLVCTAATEARSSRAVKRALTEVLEQLDGLMVRFFAKFTPDGEARGRLAASLLHSVAVRCRAGLPEQDLRRLISGALDILC